MVFIGIRLEAYESAAASAIKDFVDAHTLIRSVLSLRVAVLDMCVLACSAYPAVPTDFLLNARTALFSGQAPVKILLHTAYPFSYGNHEKQG